MKHTRLLLCVLACLTSVGARASQDPANPSPDPLQDLARAEAKWQASKIDAYEFRFQRGCDRLIAPPRPGEAAGVLFRVRDGKSRFLGFDGVAAPMPPDLVQYSAVERLFAFIRRVWVARRSSPPAGGDVSKSAFAMSVQYDQARGYPTRVCIDPSHITSDDEFGFRITDFQPLANAANERPGLLVSPSAGRASRKPVLNIRLHEGLTEWLTGGREGRAQKLEL